VYITMIGTGNAFAKRFFNNNALIEHNGIKLLIDCGTTLPYALYKQHYSFDELDGVIISHIHADHIGGLETYAYQMKFQYKRKSKLYIAADLIEPLWEHSLKGGLKQSDSDTIEDYFNVIPLYENIPHQISEGLNLTLIPTRHIPKKRSYSLLFNDSFFYSADCVFDENLLLSLHNQGVTTFYHDCQFITPGTVHATLEELLSLPVDLQKKIKLMHYADDMENYKNKTGEMSFVEQGVKVKINL